MLTGSAMALLCAAGHALAGWGMFYQPIRSAIANDLHAAVFTGMWHLITINFTLSAIALCILGTYGRGDAAARLIAVQFAGYAETYLVISLRLGGAWKLFQWFPFASTAFWSQEAFGRDNEEYRSVSSTKGASWRYTSTFFIRSISTNRHRSFRSTGRKNRQA
jgi:hypothetical protein